MSTVYTTITSKGQITLPSAARHALGLHPGQKVAVTVDGSRLIIDAPHDLDAVRAQLRAEAETAGTWGVVPQAGDGWAAHVRNKHAES
ncbi:MAG TPA: AbrB/MazE/SpoVT family DNA-binding domain-containing protein [Humibacter sp.]|jgi:AbrB family looped-hinge helix DNA binding protein|nr:AbrB/MazE/SpoVT family DNA-binding domain-containing protein [Humibacter sp.]